MSGAEIDVDVRDHFGEDLCVEVAHGDPGVSGPQVGGEDQADISVEAEE